MSTEYTEYTEYNFAVAISAILAGIPMTRGNFASGWTATISHAHSIPYVVRNQDGQSWPWGVTNSDDVQATDWRRADGNAEALDVTLNSLARVLPHLLSGGYIQRVDWKNNPKRCKMKVSLESISGFDGKCLVLTTHSGERKTFAFAPRDVVGDWVVFE